MDASVQVDKDLLLAARANAFVQSSGRFSKLMADLVYSSKKGLVIPHPFKFSRLAGRKRAYIISSSRERFDQARAVLEKFELFAPITHAPAVILTSNNSEVCGGAFPSQNGHRLAFAHVWKEIAGGDEPAAVFEDDIVPTPLASQHSIKRAIRRGLNEDKDVVFLGGDARRSYLTMHAVHFTPVAAHILHQATLRCLSGNAAFVDQTLHCACVAGDGKRDARMCETKKYSWMQRSYSGNFDQNAVLRCKPAPELDEAQRREHKKKKLFGKGFFVQNRSGGSSLHTLKNAAKS